MSIRFSWPPLLAMLALIQAAAPADAQVVRGVVIDEANRRPVVAASVAVVDESGDRVVEVVTGPAGEFAFLDLPEGEFVLAVTALGYTHRSETTFRYSGQSMFLQVALHPEPLETEGFRVTVQAEQRYLAGMGFYERRRRGHGKFVGPEDIAKLSPVRSSEILRRTAGIQLIGNREPVISRGGMNLKSGLDCVPLIYIDGVVVRPVVSIPDLRSPLAFDNVAPPPEHIEAIEVYPGGATVPLRFGGSNSACGVVLIWTKH